MKLECSKIEIDLGEDEKEGKNQLFNIAEWVVNYSSTKIFTANMIFFRETQP